MHYRAPTYVVVEKEMEHKGGHKRESMIGASYIAAVYKMSWGEAVSKSEISSLKGTVLQYCLHSKAL